MDGEQFFDALRDAVSAVRQAQRLAEVSADGSRVHLRATMGIRRHRDALSSLIAQNPEEFAGLLLALAASANETYAHVNERVARLEAALEGDGGSTVTRLDTLSGRVERLEDAASGLGDGL